eukprot:CAMPEP_0170434430 /NCGR_PEP_ID=MMETSP0117_2-20130122/43042_1 /TAXON_ID=400756 /ORGANISM="Durinskia baltica, Strain CSIRO CS-38" /LENGTH=54 /DNA_ID=CAMNT_0010694275 /DNA_START=29 /DNA_END=189 /DNA_ORIENTATION=+
MTSLVNAVRIEKGKVGSGYLTNNGIKGSNLAIRAQCVARARTGAGIVGEGTAPG